jgi:CHAT domain-containing protein
MSDAEWLLALLEDGRGKRAIAVPTELSGLADGHASLLAGNTALAARQFALEWDRRDPETALLAAHLGFYAEMRSFNHLPDGAGTSALDIRLRWAARDRASHFQGLAREARAWTTSEVSLASRWIQAASGVPSAAASLRGARDDAQLRATMLPALRGALDDAQHDASAISPAATGVARRAVAELAHHAGRPQDAADELAGARSASADAEDPCGVLACDVLAVDWRLSERSSPLVRDVELEESSGPTSELRWDLEAREGQSRAPEPGVARELEALYQRASDHGAPRCAGTIRLRQAFAASRAGDRDHAIALCQDAVRLLDGDGDALHGHLARAHLAVTRLGAGELPASLADAQQIGAWGRSAGSFSYALGLGLLMTRVARRAMVHDGDYEAAEAAFQLALALNQALGAELRTAQSHADLAMLHRSLGDRERARIHLEASLDRLHEVATAHDRHPEVPQRIALLTQELFADAVAHKDARGIAAARDRIVAIDAGGDGLADFAVKLLLETITSQADVLVPLYTAVDHEKRGDDAAAGREFATALSRARERDGDSTPFTAIVHATARRFDDALREYDAFLATGGIGRGLTSQLLARAESSDFVQRERKAMRLRQAQADLTFFVRVKAYDRARMALAQIEALADREWWRDDPKPWRPLSDIGETYEGLGMFDPATAHYQLAIDELERRRALMSKDELRTALAADHGAQFLYFQATRNELARVQRGDPARLARAFELSERGRARALLDVVAANLRRPASGEEPAVLRRWRQLTMQARVWTGMIAQLRGSTNPDATAQRIALEAQLAAAEAELQRATAELAVALPQFADAVRSEPQVAALDEVVALLPPRTAMLQYMTLGNELLSWAITRDGMRPGPIQAIRATELARAARDFHDACARGDALDPGAALAAQLVAPFDDVIAAHDRIVIAPYGELHRLPFAALPWRGDFLGLGKALSHVPSATLFAALSRAARRSPPAMLAIGDPADMGDGLPALAAARDEARHVAARYGGQALVGPDATLDNVLAALPHHHLFHFGSHAVLDHDAPLRSGIALASGARLTVQDLLALRFDADLVTLGACQTGLGAITGGEEIVGLTRGVLAAGARCLVVSLWRVNDVATALMMRAFYDALHGGALPSAALRAAQAAVRAAAPGQLDRDAAPEQPAAAQDGRHPRYWAPFVVVGVWSREGT